MGDKGNKWVGFFNRDVTFSKVVDSVISIDTPESAVDFFNAYVLHILKIRPGVEQEAAEKIARSNIGYCFGYGVKSELKRMWNMCTGAEHPYFGLREPAAAEAFELGCRLGARMKFEKTIIDELGDQLVDALEERECTHQSPLCVQDVVKK